MSDLKKRTNDEPFCFRCEHFYRDKGKHYASAHCSFEEYEHCEGRLHGAHMKGGDNA